MSRRIAIGAVELGSRPRIVAAGGQAELEALAHADGADLVEVRADLFDDAEAEVVVRALSTLRAAGRPLILTVRAAAEGGRTLPEARRRELYLAGLAHADAIDVEIASAPLAAELVPRVHAAGGTVILSAHFVDATPPRDVLLGLVDRAEALGADVTKLVAHARHLDDVRTLLGVTLEARHRGVATLAMGAVGMLSRVLFPAAGSLLTYGHVGRPTAPGQLPLPELAALVARFY